MEKVKIKKNSNIFEKPLVVFHPVDVESNCNSTTLYLLSRMIFTWYFVDLRESAYSTLPFC